MAVWTEGQYFPVRLEQARLVSSLLYGTRVMLVSKLPTFENKKYTSYDHFHGNGPYGKIPTKKEPIRMSGFTPRLPCHIINAVISFLSVSYIYFRGQIKLKPHPNWSPFGVKFKFSGEHPTPFSYGSSLRMENKQLATES